jgi:hypothetical protein
MKIGAVDYSAVLNPRSSLQRGFIKIFKWLCKNEREKKILLASKSEAHIEQIHEKREAKKSRATVPLKD